MSSVIGIDLSTKAIHLARVDETFDRAIVTRIALPGADAWTRTLTVRAALPPSSYWDDVYLVAIEAPYGRAQPGTAAALNRVVGAIAMSLPPTLRTSSHCWIVRPDEYRSALGLAHNTKPTQDDIDRLFKATFGLRDQDGRDAACLALWARDENAKAVAAA